VIRRIDRVRRIKGLALALAAFAATAGTAGAACGDSPNDKPVFLSFDACPMAQASQIAEVLNRQNVKATFFVADGSALDDDWAPWWQARVAEGHAFGARPERAVAPSGYCAEIERAATRFHAGTGRAMPKISRPAAGKTPSVLAVTAERCGWTLVSASSAVVSREVRPGDVLRVRAANLEPLIVGVKARGMCFATLREHSAYRAQFAW